MGISNQLHHILRTLFPGTTRDVEIDPWIQDALLDEALARPPAGAWERLRQAIVDRKQKNHGMWVLDEPQHDPPESPPMLLDHQEFERAQRINDLVERQGRHTILLWSGIIPHFSLIGGW